MISLMPLAIVLVPREIQTASFKIWTCSAGLIYNDAKHCVRINSKKSLNVGLLVSIIYPD